MHYIPSLFNSYKYISSYYFLLKWAVQETDQCDLWMNPIMWKNQTHLMIWLKWIIHQLGLIFNLHFSYFYNSWNTTYVPLLWQFMVCLASFFKLESLMYILFTSENQFRFGTSWVQIFIFGWTTPLRNNDPYNIYDRFRHEHPVSFFGQRKIWE